MTRLFAPATARVFVMAGCALSVVLGLAVAIGRPLEVTMPVYLSLARDLRAAPVPVSFEPIGYAWLLSVIPVSEVATAVRLAHLGAYIALMAGTAWVALASLAMSRSQTQRGIVMLAAAAVFFHPYLVVNLTRLNDNGVNVAMTALLYCLVAGPVAARGIWLGAMAAIRPNVVSLLPVLMARGRTSVWSRGATVLAGFAVVYVAFSAVAAHRVWFWSGNGPYNLFAGNNPAALASLRSDYNAEPSLVEGLHWCGVDLPPRSVGAPVYLECTLRFLTTEPVAAIRVTLYKTYLFFWRPNLRLAVTPSLVAFQLLAVMLPFWWWLRSGYELVAARRLFDPTATLFVLLFAAPFILTNADPRFRLPLDVVYAYSLMRWAPAGSREERA